MSAPSGTAKKKSGAVSKRNYDRLLAENARLRAELKKRTRPLEDSDEDLPALPDADQNGNYPAIETARAIIARQIIRARKSAGWSQAELARRAGIRQETISRIETGKHSPGQKTMAKIDKALTQAGF